MATRLMHKVRADLEPYYDANSNEKIVDYLEAIDSEITKIVVGGYYIN